MLVELHTSILHFTCAVPLPVTCSCRCLSLWMLSKAYRVQVTPYVGYSSLKDFFPTMKLKPNESCDNALCLKLQAEHLHSVPASQPADAALAEETPAHEDNEWGIEASLFPADRLGRGM